MLHVLNFYDTKCADTLPAYSLRFSIHVLHAPPTQRYPDADIVVVESDPPPGTCLACAPLHGYAKHTCSRSAEKLRGRQAKPLGENYNAFIGRNFVRVRGGDAELVVLTRESETLLDLAQELSLDHDALLGLNKDYIQSIQLHSKLYQGTYVRVPDIPRFSSRVQQQRKEPFHGGKSNWSAKEDQLLVQWVAKNGARQWSSAARSLASALIGPPRKSKACRERWCVS